MRADNVRKHHQRIGRVETPEINGNAELESAWHSLQLHWLATVPGYREEIKQRVAAAARQAEKKSNRQMRQDKDLLGREVEGCG